MQADAAEYPVMSCFFGVYERHLPVQIDSSLFSESEVRPSFRLL